MPVRVETNGFILNAYLNGNIHLYYHNPHTPTIKQTRIEQKCNVCQTEFNIKEFTRDKLMLEFTGDEIANMINAGYYIVSGEKSSKHNREILEKYRENRELIDNITHWTNAVFLITPVL